MILELRDICKEYIQGKMSVPVLHHISFSMEEGEYVAIMGPSGSGKTTLMNIIGCLDQATSGTFFLDGEDISKCNDDRMSEIRRQNWFCISELSSSAPADSTGKCRIAADLCGNSQKEEQDRVLEPW